MAKFKTQSKYICSLYACLALLLPVKVTAQTDESQQDLGGRGLEEIVLISRIRAENHHGAPIFLAACSAEEIESRGASDVMGVAGVAPNVTSDLPAPLSGRSSASHVFNAGNKQYSPVASADLAVMVARRCTPDARVNNIRLTASRSEDI